VSWLVRHRVKRGIGVAVVLLAILAIIGGFLAAAIPAVAAQITQLVANAPKYLAQAQDHSSFLGKLNDKYDLVSKVQTAVSTSGTTIADGLIGAGTAIFNGLADTLIVFVLTIYFLADFPRIRAFLYRFLPGSRRPRAILIGDDILSKVGGYVLGNLIISVIAGALSFIWLLSFHVPYPLLLAILVALLDLVPVIGSTVAGIAVALVALTVSLPVALLTVGFFVLYRLAEDYYLVPRIIGRAVEVPALVTVVAVLVGGALLGVLGALVAIPIAAGVLLILREVLFPRLDEL
jgi:predicted PurR-regulated permease PerM